MDNNNIGSMNPQQFSQNTPQTSQPHRGKATHYMVQCDDDTHRPLVRLDRQQNYTRI